MSPNELQEILWKKHFAGPADWWDNRRSQPTTQHPDLKHKKSEIALSLDNTHKPPSLQWQLARWNAGRKKTPASVSTSIQGQGEFMAREGRLVLKSCRKLCEEGRISDAVDALSKLVEQRRHIHNNLFYRVLKSCISNKDLALGRRVHALSVESGYEGDAFLATHFIGLYASHGRLEEAMRVFTKVSTPDAYNWATIIFAYARQGEAAEAIRLYRRMRESTAIEPDNRIYLAVLKACAAAGDLVAGKQVHAHILASPEKPDVFVMNGLVDMYAKCKSLGDARRVFDGLPVRNVVIWTAMIAGYSQQGMFQEALRVYRSMQLEGLTAPNSVTYVCLLQACASVGVGALHEGKQLHTQIKEQGLQEDAVLGGSLVNMYAKCGSLADARRVFDKLPARNLIACNAILAGYAQLGMGQEAFRLYRRMQLEGLNHPDSVTYTCLLQACASVGVGALLCGKQIHAEIEEKGLRDDIVLACSLVNMYAKCGSLEDARSVFDLLPAKDVVTWTTMIAGYVQQGMGQEALSLYSSMQLEGFSFPNSVTYVCLLQACAGVAALPLGEQLHAEIEKRGMQADVGVGAALVNMYAKCGSMFESQRVFDSLPERSVQTWGALISGYAHQGYSHLVFDLFDRMRGEGIQPDGITFLSVLTVCSHVGLVDEGRECFEAMTTDYGISPTLEHFTCMMDLLGRAGYLDDALQMVKTMPFPANDVVWLTLLGACLKWKNVEIGQQAFEAAVSVDEKNSASYVMMYNIYASAKMWEAAKDMQSRRNKVGAWKRPGQSWWTDMGGVVHLFVVGDKMHPERDNTFARLEQLAPTEG